LADLDTRIDTRPAPGARKPSPRRTTATAIFDELLGAIVSLKLEPGAPLQEKLIAEQFGVSRTPVREALIRLAEAGLVDIFPQSGTFVAPIPVLAIPEALLIRKALEGVTVEMAAEIATDDDVALLDAILARQAAFAGLGDTAAFHEADEAFHEAIAGIARHPGIWRTIRPVKVQIDRARRLTLPAPGRMDHVIGEHRSIRDAIAAGDRAAARAAMMSHLEAVIVDVKKLAQAYQGYFTG